MELTDAEKFARSAIDLSTSTGVPIDTAYDMLSRALAESRPVAEGMNWWDWGATLFGIGFLAVLPFLVLAFAK